MTSLSRTISGTEKEEQEAWFDAFLDATPSQVENWIENNVNDMASAKTVLKKMAKIVVILAKRERARTRREGA